LRQQGLAPEWFQVDHESDYCAQLHAELDLIVTKYALPMFDAPRALQLVQERGLAIPVIVIAEPNNEEAALDCLRNGAADYLSSDRLARLGMAAVRAIEHTSRGTERMLAELVWRESLHQAVLRSLTAHLAVLDASGMVVLVNKPWEDPVCEHSLPHMMLARVGMNYLNGCQMILGDDADLAHQMIVGIQAVLNRTDDHFVLEYMRMQGSEERWFVLDVTPVDRNHVGAIVAHKNITLRKRAEVALEQERALLSRRVDEQTADLRLANAELARSARLKDEFLANMSHELRTPLNAILGLSEALQEQLYGSLNDKQLRTLRNIEESGRHLLALINDILDLSKIEAGKIDIDTCAIDVLAVCRTSLQFIAQQALHKQISLMTSFDPAVTWIMAD
jgi:signal transduction histidine kinase